MPITNIADHIAGITNTASVTVGANTDAPYAGVTVTGATDGTSIGTASKNMAEIYNRALFAERHLIEAAGLAFDEDDWSQQTKSIKVLAANPATDTTRGAVENATTAEVGAGALDGAVSISPLNLYEALDPAGSANNLKSRVQSLAGVGGSIKSFARFDGITTATILASSNILSIVRTSSGVYKVDFLTPMQDANYSILYSAKNTGNRGFMSTVSQTPPTTTTFYCCFTDVNGGNFDTSIISLAVVR